MTRHMPEEKMGCDVKAMYVKKTIVGKNYYLTTMILFGQNVMRFLSCKDFRKIEKRNDMTNEVNSWIERYEKWDEQWTQQDYSY